jgi:hypothetical protein
MRMEGGEHALSGGQSPVAPTPEAPAAQQQAAPPKAEPGRPPEGGGGTAAPIVAGAAGSADGPIYVSKREVRKHAGKALGKKAAYFLEFYLVDNHGYETLAAVGEDQGPHSFLSSSTPHDIVLSEKETLLPDFGLALFGCMVGSVVEFATAGNSHCEV